MCIINTVPIIMNTVKIIAIIIIFIITVIRAYYYCYYCLSKMSVVKSLSSRSISGITIEIIQNDEWKCCPLSETRNARSIKALSKPSTSQRK